MKLSVITINLNNASGLEATINSVVSQSFRDFEFIVVDGNSSDDSLGIISKHRSNISKVITGQDTGIYNAMNKGLSIAAGDYSLFLNSGDCLNGEKVLEEVFSYHHDSDLVTGTVILKGSDKEDVFEIPDPEQLTFRYFLKSTIPHPGTFIKRELLKSEGGYSENFRICSDFDFFVKVLFKRNATLKKISTVVSVFDYSGLSSKTGSAELIKSERESILSEHFSRFLPDYYGLAKLEEDYIDLRVRYDNNYFVRAAEYLKRIKKSF
jgi:glycosyltransferase involved in cell wall biosynthesis